MTDLTNFLQESDKLVYGPVVLLAPEWTAVKRALCQWCRHWSPSHAGSRAWCRLRTPGWKFQWSLTCERGVVDQRVRLLIHGSAKGIYLRTDPHRRWRGRSGGWSRRWERLWRVQSGESKGYQTHMRLTHGWNDAHQHLSQCHVRDIIMSAEKHKKIWREKVLFTTELCETEVCFLHIPHMGTNVWLPKSTEFLLMLILSGLLQNPSLETILVCIVVLCFTQNNTANIHLCDEWTRSNASRAFHKDFVHFVTARASLLTDLKISGLSIRAKYRHFRTICEHAVDKSPIDLFSSSLNWWSSMHAVATLYNCWVVSFANSQYLSTHYFAWPSMS